MARVNGLPPVFHGRPDLDEGQRGEHDEESGDRDPDKHLNKPVEGRAADRRERPDEFPVQSFARCRLEQRGSPGVIQWRGHSAVM